MRKAVAIAWMLSVGLLFLGANASGKQPKYVEPVAQLRFLVLKDANGKPVRNAAVVMHEVGKHDKQERGGVELKTDADGKASFEGIPYGKLRVQVLATGFQTFGADYEVNQATVEITIKLKRPEGQYSIYDDHPTDEKKDDKNKNSPPDPNAKPQR
jgi:Carboxypeptidase regulatory-like domain